MAKTTKFLTFTLDFGSTLGFLKVDISKTARETCTQNFTRVFTCLKSLKNGIIVFGGGFDLKMGFGSTYCVEPQAISSPNSSLSFAQMQRFFFDNRIFPLRNQARSLSSGYQEFMSFLSIVIDPVPANPHRFLLF